MKKFLIVAAVMSLCAMSVVIASPIGEKNVFRIEWSKRDWSTLSEPAKEDLYVRWIDAADRGEFFLVRNRVDESFRQEGLQNLSDSEGNAASEFVYHGFPRLEVLGDELRSSVTGRIQCCLGRGLVAKLSSNPKFDDFMYRPSVMMNEEPLLCIFERMEMSQAVAWARVNWPQSSWETNCLFSTSGPLPDCSLPLYSLSTGCCFRLDIKELRFSDSFSDPSLIPEDQIEWYRSLADATKKGSWMVTLSSREASELLYVLLGEERYKSRVKPGWFAPAESLRTLETEIGKSLAHLKYNPEELEKLREKRSERSKILWDMR